MDATVKSDTARITRVATTPSSAGRCQTCNSDRRCTPSPRRLLNKGLWGGRNATNGRLAACYGKHPWVRQPGRSARVSYCAPPSGGLYTGGVGRVRRVYPSAHDPSFAVSPRASRRRRLSPAIRSCSQALFRLMPRWGTRRLPRVSQAMDRSTMGRWVR